MLTLKRFNDQYEEILFSNNDLTDDEKSIKLSSIMTQMEQTFKIPVLKNIEWEQKNEEVIALYRKISFSRDQIGVFVLRLN